MTRQGEPQEESAGPCRYCSKPTFSGDVSYQRNGAGQPIKFHPACLVGIAEEAVLALEDMALGQDPKAGWRKYAKLAVMLGIADE